MLISLFDEDRNGGLRLLSTDHLLTSVDDRIIPSHAVISSPYLIRAIQWGDPQLIDLGSTSGSHLNFPSTFNDQALQFHNSSRAFNLSYLLNKHIVLPNRFGDYQDCKGNSSNSGYCCNRFYCRTCGYILAQLYASVISGAISDFKLYRTITLTTTKGYHNRQGFDRMVDDFAGLRTKYKKHHPGPFSYLYVFGGGSRRPHIHMASHYNIEVGWIEEEWRQRTGAYYVHSNIYLNSWKTAVYFMDNYLRCNKYTYKPPKCLGYSADLHLNLTDRCRGKATAILSRKFNDPDWRG